ncbi:MAG: hypothetical protein CTY34_04230 [Methylobacter sp.]|nr:MAG: hypothetical protein CTY34_04230 [Methylobacter sp.]PPD23740.1 MAG: hypothetical protein CTY24_03360 [Methylobacter sp.]PPD32485.1 MAG: hypothetical protein CTY18_10215 [Methylomonas sp.]
MDNSWHQSVPDSEVGLKNLLLTTDRQGLLNWLHALSALPVTDIANTLRKALAVLNQHQAETGVLVWLDDLSGYLDDFSRQVERTLLDSGLPLDSRQQATIETTAKVNQAMAEYYAQLLDLSVAQSLSAAGNPAAYFIVQALKSAGNVLLMACQTYQPPFSGFWPFCYQLYKRADTAGILTDPVTLAGGKTVTIAQAFNEMILLQLADMNQFRPQEMRTIHQIFSELPLAPAFTTLPVADGRRWYLLDLAAGQPPALCKATPAGQSADCFYICGAPVARQLEVLLQSLHAPTALKRLNPALFIRVIKTLSGQLKRAHTRLAKAEPARAICGFSNIVDYMRQHTAFKVKTGSDASKTLSAADLSLVPQGNEFVHQLQWRYRDDASAIGKIVSLGNALDVNSAVWKTPEEEVLPPKVEALNINILDSSVRGFKILWPQTGQAIKVGELIALLQEDGRRLETGLIRRISKLSAGGVVLGVEMIGFECELVRFARPGLNRESKWAIVLPGIQALKQSDSLVFNTSGFAAGESIVLNLDQITVGGRLVKLINVTPAVSHAELLYYRQDET